MKWVAVTRWFMVGIIVIVAVYDIAALAIGGGTATISDAVGIRGSFESPFIPFAVGFTMGHLFWPQKAAKGDDPPAS